MFKTLHNKTKGTRGITWKNEKKRTNIETEHDDFEQTNIANGDSKIMTASKAERTCKILKLMTNNKKLLNNPLLTVFSRLLYIFRSGAMVMLLTRTDVVFVCVFSIY